MNTDFIKELKFDSNGLIPAIAQDYLTGEVLMCAYMNKESLHLTLETGHATYFSRSRQELWEKGAHSGHLQFVKEILVDCDADALVLKIEQVGAACHTGNRSCFFRKVEDGSLKEIETGLHALNRMLYEEVDVAKERRDNPKEGSYTNFLLDEGVDKIAKKVGEEAAEVIIAAKNHSKDEMRYEVADLLYHLSVLLVEQDMEWDDIFGELAHRRGKQKSEY